MPRVGNEGYPGSPGNALEGVGLSVATGEIDNNAVTNTKLADMAVDTMKGRAAAGTGDPEDISVTAAGRAILDDADAPAQRTTLGVGTGDSPTLTALTLSNGQLVFPATQVASAGANTLDDYEEGTFTPTLMDSTLDGTGESQTYTIQVGRYTKVGRVVYFYIDIEASSIGTLTTTQRANIGGLPFTNAAGIDPSIAIGYGDSLVVTANQVVTGRVAAGVSYIVLAIWDAAAGTSDFLISGYSAGGRLVLSGHYQV